MLNLFKYPTAIGLELQSEEIQGAELFLKNGKPLIKNLFTMNAQTHSLSQTHPFSFSPPLLVTALEGCDVLVRTMNLPLTKEKDIDASLVFQAEPLLPYPVDQALLCRQILSQNGENSTLTLLSARKDLLQKHLELWQHLKIEPEKVGSIQTALCHFSKVYLIGDKPHILLHIGNKWITCVLVKEGKLLAAYSVQEGLEALKGIQEQDISISESLNSEPINRLQQAVHKLCYAITKESKGEPIEGIILTGQIQAYNSLKERLIEKLNLPLLDCVNSSEAYDSNQLQKYAIPIGLALGALQNGANFRQQELAYPTPWKRFAIPLGTYFTGMILLTVVFHFFGQAYLDYKENKLKQEYVDLLTSLNKSYDQFEQSFLLKTPLAREKNNGEVLAVANLNRDDLLERLEFIHKDIQGTPDSFPLFANTPTVSDVLVWLSNHPYVVHVNEDGSKESRLELENFNYTMLKRPVQGKKQEKYQVKVELEFSSPTPKWAREFHDALIVPNDYVDAKSEVKWSTNRGHYRTSFYLKDKTLYPN